MKVYVKNFKVFNNNTAFAITGAVKVTSQMKLYSELNLKFLKFKRRFKKLCLFYKIKKNWHTGYNGTKQPSVQLLVN